MAVTLLFFGRLRDAAGGGRKVMDAAAGLSPAALLDLLEREDPVLAAALRAPDVRLGLNRRVLPVGENVVLRDGDELAFMPPATGG